MEKIQTEVMPMLQAGRKTGSSYRMSGTDAAFNKMLKEHNQTADDRTTKTAVSGEDSQKETLKAEKEELKPAKESGQKGKPEEAEDSVKNGEMVSSELLLKLQESAGQLAMTFAESAADASEQTGEVLEAVSASPPELLVTAEAEVQELPLQTETSELQNIAGSQTAQTAAQEAKPEVQLEKAVSGQEKEGAVKAEQKPAEPLKSQEPETEQKLVKPETSAKAFGSETRENTESEQQQLAGMAETPLREYAVREPEHMVSEPVRTSESTLVNDVGRAIAQRLPANNGTLTIELEPASLGKMTIRVLYESGKATLSIFVTNPKTLEILNARAGELASILEERTGQETIVYTEQPESEHPFDERQGEGRQRDREPENREHKERNEQDSFLQQLRLGVI